MRKFKVMFERCLRVSFGFWVEVNKVLEVIGWWCYFLR